METLVLSTLQLIVPRVLVALFLVAGCLFQPISSALATTLTPPAKAVATLKTAKKPVSVELLTLLKTPTAYLQNPVKFSGTFSSFSSLGLDYKPAFRDGKDHVLLLFFRPDALPAHKIPLSEVKIFIQRKESEKLPDLETNDLVTIIGTPFSNALGDVWVDVNQLTITQKAPRKPKDN
jgi:hypothetical protein